MDTKQEEVSSFQDDLSADLTRAFEDAEKSAPVETPEPVLERPAEAEKPEGDRARGTDGKFAKAEESKAEPDTIVEEIKADENWPTEVKAMWQTLPADARKFLKNSFDGIQSERKGFEADRGFAKQLRDVAQPYMAMIQSEGSDLPKAVSSLLQTAYLLRHAPAEQKRAAILGIAEKFGVDLGSPAQAVEGAGDLPPEIAGMQKQFAQTQTSLSAVENTIKQMQEAQQRQAFHTLFTEFETDKQNFPHFAEVYSQMTDLVASIRRNNPGIDDRSVLKQAYENAVWLNPATRARLQISAVKEPGEKTVVAAKAAVRGGPQGAAPTKPQVKVHDDPRDDIAHWWNQAESGSAA